MEILFKLKFAIQFNEELRYKALDSFIEYIEENRLLYGGGMNEFEINGGVYYQKENEVSSIDNLKSILKIFFLENQATFSKLTFIK